MCEHMQVRVCVCIICVKGPLPGVHSVKEKLLAPSRELQILQNVLLALLGHILDSGPLFPAPMCIPSLATAEGKGGDPGRTSCLAQVTQSTPMSQTLLLPDQALSKVAAAERVVRRPSYVDLFRTPRLRHISLCCMVVW